MLNFVIITIKDSHTHRFYSDYNQDGSGPGGRGVWKYGNNRTFYISPYMYNNLPNGKLPVNRPGQMDCFNIYTGIVNNFRITVLISQRLKFSCFANNRLFLRYKYMYFASLLALVIKIKLHDLFS